MSRTCSAAVCHAYAGVMRVTRCHAGPGYMHSKRDGLACKDTSRCKKGSAKEFEVQRDSLARLPVCAHPSSNPNQLMPLNAIGWPLLTI